MTTKDRIVHVSGPFPYTGAVNPKRENRAAHGGVMLVEIRADGATRHVNRNGNHSEIGPWIAPNK